ncbi:putative Major Facilitator Superfamily [Leishmania naiffi]|uniref:Major Facilitator Superfamily n=1 Tax=Leishmania naiffi TaxID=5678 RepID=A0AAW3C0V9_9TRYP
MLEFPALQEQERQPVCPRESSLPSAPVEQDTQKYGSTNLPDTINLAKNSKEYSDSDSVIKVTPFRFVIVTLFAAFGFINQVQYVAFASIVRETEAYFSVNALEVNLLSLVIPIIYAVGVVPGCYLYNKVGLRYGMIIGAALNAFASVLKFIAVWVPKYAFLVASQLFVAGGQILFLSLPPLIAGIWFPPKERTMATALASLMGFAGMAVGMFYSPHVIFLPNNNTRKQWAASMGFQFGFSLLVLLLMIALAREKPKYRPSFTSTEHYKMPLLKFLKFQFQDFNFVLLTITFGLITGFPTALVAVLAQVLEPFGISEAKSGILAFSGILSGSANCALVGCFVDRTHYYRYTTLALVAVSVALLLVVTIVTKTSSNSDALIIFLYIIVPLLAFLVLPIIPVVMELAVELAYPCPETVSSTIALASMCFFSFVGMIVFSFTLGDTPTVDRSFNVFLITSVVSTLSAVLLFFVKERLRRKAQDDGL